jgi:hypothetical protein
VKYDPDQDRAALRQAARASYDASSNAVGIPLLPEKAADIKAALDESLAQANLASNRAKSLETTASQRADAMAGELKGHGAPAPASDAKDLNDAAAASRARLKTLSKDHDDLQARVSALPDANKDKASLNAVLGNSAASLTAADSALTQAEAAGTTATAAVAAMALAEKRARHSADERSAADADVSRLDEALPAAVSDAKSAVDMLGQEPQSANRTRAGQKLAVPHDLTGQLYTAADRACNRADDYHSRSAAFDAAQADFDAAKTAGASTADAKTALDSADSTQAGVRSRLDHPK